MITLTARPSSAIVFGAHGAIGRAMTQRLIATGLYDTVYAGVRRSVDDVPQGARSFLFDLSNEASIEEACASLSAPPTMVFVATGILHDDARNIAPEKTYRALNASSLTHVFAVNTFGPALIAKHCFGKMPRDRRAVFAAVSARVGSISDNRLGGWHAYRASKAALNMLIRNFAIELARTHPEAIIAALHPGTVESGLSEPFLGSAAPNMPLSPEQSAGYLWSVIEKLTPEDSGGLFAWDGKSVPW